MAKSLPIKVKVGLRVDMASQPLRKSGKSRSSRKSIKIRGSPNWVCPKEISPKGGSPNGVSPHQSKLG